MGLPEKAIYLDNHATTRLDPRVLEAMLPYFTEIYGNAASTSHVYGWQAKDAVESARETIAAAIGATAREIYFTSGATESNNLAIRGVAERASPTNKRLVSVCTEHPSVLDPIKNLAQRGWETILLPVRQAPETRAGLIELDQLAAALRAKTTLVSVMLANNEIGAIQPIAEIAKICHEAGALVHTDATQAVGKLPVNVNALDVDLMSFTAHKLYGPKGIGALYVRRRSPPIRIEPLLYGGGHERGLRSGTLNVAGIVGFARAVELSVQQLPDESVRLRNLRDQLYRDLLAAVPRTTLNGPALQPPDLRLPGNLNLCFHGVDGETLLLTVKDVVALSSGSACSSANPEPSHVLKALGMTDEAVRGSIRFGLGRFNTPEELDRVVPFLAEAIHRLRTMAC